MHAFVSTDKRTRRAEGYAYLFGEHNRLYAGMLKGFKSGALGSHPNPKALLMRLAS